MFTSHYSYRFFSRPMAKAFLAGFVCLSAALLTVAGCGGGDDDEPFTRTEKILFTSSDEGYEGINTINPDGTGRRLVFRTDADSATFSPDGEKIAFLSIREDCGGAGCETSVNEGSDPYPKQVWLINADGSGLRQLTRQTREEFSAYDPMFSPDGSRVFYNTFRNGESSLHAVDLDAGGDTVLFQGERANMKLSPDGSKLLFTADSDPSETSFNYDIYVMNVDGSARTRLTTHPAQDSSPSFSQDGSRILFLRYDYPADLPPEIYVMNADGSGQTRLTNNTDIDFNPSFSPDGTKIVFQSNRGVGANLADASPTRVFVMNADGTDQHPIPDRGTISPYSEFYDDVSPYNAWAFTTAR